MDKRDGKKILAERKALQERFGFPDWHVNPGNDYSSGIANYIVTTLESVNHVPLIVECGCGLCDIIGSESLASYRRIGIDKNETLLNADREVFGDSIEFIQGSFDKIRGMDIDFLISVNFPHSIAEEDLMAIYRELFSENNIAYYIVDEVTGKYPYHHDYSRLLEGMCSLVDSLGPYAADGGVRWIRIFGRVSD